MGGSAPQQVYKASQYRDGLVISILIRCPMRLRNLTEIVIGRHLIFDGRTYHVGSGQRRPEPAGHTSLRSRRS